MRKRLSKHQWDEIIRRATVEPNTKLAEEFGIPESTIRARIKKEMTRPESESDSPTGKAIKQEVRAAAEKIVESRQALANLTETGRKVAYSLADELEMLGRTLMASAQNGARTSRKLSAIAAKQVAAVNREKPMESQEELQAIAALTKISNEAGSMGMSLLNLGRAQAFAQANEKEAQPVSITVEVKDARKDAEP